MDCPNGDFSNLFLPFFKIFTLEKVWLWLPPSQHDLELLQGILKVCHVCSGFQGFMFYQKCTQSLETTVHMTNFTYPIFFLAVNCLNVKVEEGRSPASNLLSLTRTPQGVQVQIFSSLVISYIVTLRNFSNTLLILNSRDRTFNSRWQTLSPLCISLNLQNF